MRSPVYVSLARTGNVFLHAARAMTIPGGLTIKVRSSWLRGREDSFGSVLNKLRVVNGGIVVVVGVGSAASPNTSDACCPQAGTFT